MGVSYDSGYIYQLKPRTKVFAKMQIIMNMSKAFVSVKIMHQLRIVLYYGVGSKTLNGFASSSISWTLTQLICILVRD